MLMMQVKIVKNVNVKMNKAAADNIKPNVIHSILSSICCHVKPNVIHTLAPDVLM